MNKLTHFKLSRLNQLLIGVFATMLSNSSYADDLSSEVFCQLAKDTGGVCVPLPSTGQDSEEWQNAFVDAVVNALTEAAASPTVIVKVKGTGQGNVTNTSLSCNTTQASCEKTYPKGTQLTFTATANNGSKFVGWDGDCANGSVTLNTGSSLCLAYFELLSTGGGTTGGGTTGSGTTGGGTTGTSPSTSNPTLFVEIGGTGNGSVSTNSVNTTNLSCEGSNGKKCEVTYTSKTSTLNLTATAKTGSTFVGWGGHTDCADGKVTLSSSKLCIAYFTVDPPTGRITGLSVRALIGAQPENNLFAGVTVSSSTAGKEVLVQAQGKILQTLVGLSTELAPQVEIRTYPNREIISGSVDNSRTDLDTQVITRLNEGLYTMQMIPKDVGGIGIINVADNAPTAEAELLGISARAFVGAKPENYTYAGLSVTGHVRVAIQGFGQGMNQLGAASALDAQLVVQTYPEGQVIGYVKDWQDDPVMAGQVKQWKQMPLTDSDAALILELDEGLYTIALSPQNGTAGIGMVNVYLLK